MKKTAPSLAVLKDIIKSVPTPFHLYDERGIKCAASALNRVFSWNPGFREYFAVKALPNPHILSLLKAQGCGVECSSMTELMLAQACGFAGDEIMFSANAMPAEEFVKAREMGAIINLDDITHIDFLQKNGGIPKTICLRYNPGGDFRIGNTIMGNPGEAKYGMTRPQLTDAVRRLAGMGATRFGLHAFLSSNTTDDAYYPALARLLFETAVALHRETGATFTFVNLSGGIGIPYREEEEPIDIGAVGLGVQRAYDEVIVPSALGDVAVYAELGRYMTGPHGYLVATALHEKHIYRDYIGLDACAADLMRPAMYGAYHFISVAGKEHAPRDHKYDITGSLCENNDKFAQDRMLPKIDMGDIVVIHDTGAHGHSMGYNYNGRLRSAEVLLKEDGSFSQIRRAETPADYFATLDFENL